MESYAKDAAANYGLLGSVILTLLGLLIWLVRHIFTVTVPQMLATFSAEQRAERESCEKRHTENLVAHSATQESLKELVKGLNKVNESIVLLEARHEEEPKRRT